MKFDKQLAAFICGLFIGLMVVRRIGRKVIEVDVEKERQGRATDSESDTRPSPYVVPFPATG